ncbi:MAG TPA: hypothetical protein VFO69_03500 [Allosphingosinicella sp.]|nr:hypothetical protein [Allosphingosinicella sp.]
MERILGFAVLSAGLVLAGCNSAAVTTQNDSAVESANAMQTRLEALPEAQRNGVFMRAIRDAEGACQHVERSEPVGAHQGLPVWRAYCQGGATFTIVISRGGAAQVMNDADVRLGHEAPPKDGGRGQ